MEIGFGNPEGLKQGSLLPKVTVNLVLISTLETNKLGFN